MNEAGSILNGFGSSIARNSTSLSGPSASADVGTNHRDDPRI